MEISIRRVSYLSLLGFLTVFALACASSGCTGSPDEAFDDGMTDPADPIEPDLPEVEPATCGTEAVDAFGDYPLPPNWVDGYPLVVGDDYVAYVDVVETTFFSGLMLRVFQQDGPGVQEHWLWSYDLRDYTEGSFAGYGVHDMVVRDGMIHVLWQASMMGPDGSPDAFPVNGLTVVMPSLNLAGTSGLPQINWSGEDAHFAHRLAFDGNGDLHLGSYNYHTGELAHRPFTKSHWGYALVAVDSEPVHRLGDIWRHSVLNAFSVEDGALIYRIGGPQRAMTVTHRPCP